MSQGIPMYLYGQMYTSYALHIKETAYRAMRRENALISKGGEIIVPASGETAEDISRASILENPGWIIGGDLNVLYPDPSINPTFLCLVLTYGNAHDDLTKRAQGKTIVHLHASDLGTVRFASPSLAEQTTVSKMVDAIESCIALRQRKLDKLKQLKTPSWRGCSRGRARIVLGSASRASLTLGGSVFSVICID